MAENLWALREAKRLSVATLASRAGLPIGLIMEYESGARSIDPRHLSRLAKALYVEESEIRMRCEPRPGGAALERQAPPRPEPRPAMPQQPPYPGAAGPAPASAAPPAAASRQRGMRPPRQMSEPRPPAPARPSQIAHLTDLIGRLGKDRAALEAELGKPLEELDRLAASSLLGKLQLELRNAPSPERHRAYLPEAVDQYEHNYLNSVKESAATLQFTLFNGERLEGQVAGYGPYNITVRQADGGEVTLNKLAIVSYRRARAEAEGADQ
jgi:transcriptional regulator with XRE-family HTH domain